MAFLRFFAIAVLVYFGYKFIKNLSKKNGYGTPLAKQHFRKPADILVEDPVCKKLVPQHQAVMWQKDGKIFYFCSGQCCATFQEQGEKR